MLNRPRQDFIKPSRTAPHPTGSVSCAKASFLARRTGKKLARNSYLDLNNFTWALSDHRDSIRYEAGRSYVHLTVCSTSRTLTPPLFTCEFLPGLLRNLGAFPHRTMLARPWLLGNACTPRCFQYLVDYLGQCLHAHVFFNISWTIRAMPARPCVFNIWWTI